MFRRRSCRQAEGLSPEFDNCRPGGFEMSKNNATCDHESLELLLCDKLADDRREALESHLGDCAPCRERLEQLAAEPALWAEAHEALSSAGELHGFAGSSAGSEGSSVLSRADADVARAEHILGFLSPTDDPRMLGRFGGYEIAGVIG